MNVRVKHQKNVVNLSKKDTQLFVYIGMHEYVIYSVSDRIMLSLIHEEELL